jgi:salicylate hydroxylase
VTTSHNIVVAGAGIGGLTAALTLAKRGCRVSILEQAPRLEAVGAGIQLGPNATRILRDLGVADRLRSAAVVPDGLVVRSAAAGQCIVRMPLGVEAECRHGAPYWMVHRGDLQAALVATVEATPDITMMLGAKVEDFSLPRHGVAVQVRLGTATEKRRCDALIGADGLWSAMRPRLGNSEKPRFRNRTAWRSLIAATEVPEPFREPVVQLWLGRDAHLVHYPVCGGKAINIVAIARDAEERTGWSGEGARAVLMENFPGQLWSQQARSLLMLPSEWLTWSLYDMPALRTWGEGPVTLLGDAAHPMLPFLAQGAGMAIEDAAVLAQFVAQKSNDIPAALRGYETARRSRTARLQQASRRNGEIYHKSGPEALIRNIGMRMIGGRRLIGRYDWIYGWRDREPDSTTAGMREAATLK